MKKYRWIIYILIIVGVYKYLQYRATLAVNNAVASTKGFLSGFFTGWSLLPLILILFCLNAMAQPGNFFASQYRGTFTGIFWGDASHLTNFPTTITWYGTFVGNGSGLTNLPPSGWTNNGVFIFPTTNGPVNFFAIDGQGNSFFLSTNSGALKAYSVSGSATNLSVLINGNDGSGIFAGKVTATNGLASYAANLVAPVTITVGSSPFSYTNTADILQQCFIDSNGATDTLAVNGTTVFTSLALADHSVLLQKNEYITITYSLATPILKVKPL